MTYIDDIIKSTGEERATIKKIDQSDVNRWGDADESVDETEVSAVFEVLSAESQEVKEGDFESGDLRAYLPVDFDSIVEGNVLVYQDKEYRIDEVIKHEIGNEGHYEVTAGRV